MISYKANNRRYTTLIKPERVYISKCLILNQKEERRAGEERRKILRKILGPRKRSGRREKGRFIYPGKEVRRFDIPKRRLAF